MLGAVQFVVWHIEGWVAWPRLQSTGEAWTLLIQAQTEILSLRQFEWTGWTLSWFIGSWVTWKMIESPVKGALPLAYHQFNAFHHGNKVIKQDVEVLEELIMEGEKANVMMPALKVRCSQARKSMEG